MTGNTAHRRNKTNICLVVQNNMLALLLKQSTRKRTAFKLNLSPIIRLIYE